MNFNKAFDLSFKLLKTCIFTFIVFLLFSGTYAILYESIGNSNLAYIIAYFIFILYLVYRNFNYLKKCIKDLKKEKKNEITFIFLKSFAIIFISQILYMLLARLNNNISDTQEFNNNMLLNSKILLSFIYIILAPIFEEFIFRLPYLKIKESNKVKFIFYSFIFAFAHINFLNLNDYIFIPSYFLLSIGIGYPFYKKDNILLSMFSHMFNNVIMILIILFF